MLENDTVIRTRLATLLRWRVGVSDSATLTDVVIPSVSRCPHEPGSSKRHIAHYRE